MVQASRNSCVKSSFGTLSDGRDVDLYTLVNSHGASVSITTFGATVVSIIVPDRNGVMGDVALGFDSVDGYVQSSNPFIGATIGRYGNRIARGKFSLNGRGYTLAINNGVNHLHGGPGGFDKVLWRVDNTPAANASEVIMSYTSPDGEEGYPGTLEVSVRFVLTDTNELQFHYRAVSDADTVLNLTNHSYFNLGSEATILAHQLKMSAPYFTPVDDTQIPTGEIRSVTGTPFDFTSVCTIGDRIDQAGDEQLRYGAGYDHNFVVSESNTLKHVATAFSPDSGRVLDVLSTEPGVQLYTGNFLDGSLKGKKGIAYGRRCGFCLETQHYPDSPNKPSFPSTLLKAGVPFASTTINRFSVADSIN